jgi:hypothetical protein
VTFFADLAEVHRESLAALDTISFYDFLKMFPAVGASLRSLHPITGGLCLEGD